MNPCDCDEEKHDDEWGDKEPEENSRLAQLELRPHHNTPYALYLDWIKEAERSCLSKGHTQCFVMATTSRKGDIGCRMLSLREFRNNMFIFTISQFSETYRHLKETRKATMLFYLHYFRYRSHISRQIRIEGRVKRLCSGITELYHDKEKLHNKVKYEICNSGQLVDWNCLKKLHDRTVVKYRCGQNELKMPDIYIGYALIPHKFEFFHTEEGYIADRVTFEKNCDCGWAIRRIMA